MSKRLRYQNVATGSITGGVNMSVMSVDSAFIMSSVAALSTSFNPRSRSRRLFPTTFTISLDDLSRYFGTNAEICKLHQEAAKTAAMKRVIFFFLFSLFSQEVSGPGCGTSHRNHTFPSSKILPFSPPITKNHSRVHQELVIHQVQMENPPADRYRSSFPKLFGDFWR